MSMKKITDLLTIFWELLDEIEVQKGMAMDKERNLYSQMGLILVIRLLCLFAWERQGTGDQASGPV